MKMNGVEIAEDFLLKAFEENTKSHREQKEEILEQQTPNTSSDIFFSARVKIAVPVSTDFEDNVIFFIKDF